MSPTYRSFAKVNLHLEVRGRRPDGYHELATVFQTVDFCDLLTLELEGRGVSLEIAEGGAPAGAENLAHSAAMRFLERWWPDGGVNISLRQGIPMRGGLGGGSSNAATVLLAMQELLGSPARAQDLELLARELGADVPYFLVGGTAVGLGRGDEVRPVAELPETQLWLATPPVGISTAEVFAAWDHLTARPATSSIGRLAEGSLADWPEVAEGRNDLEALVVGRYPPVKRLYDARLGSGASWVRFSGSDSTLLAWFSDSEASTGLEARLPAGCNAFRARTLTRRSCRELRSVQ